MRRNLTQPFTGLWNKIKGRSFRVVAAEHVSEDSIVVFVVGPTGSGKSWFIREATKSDLVKASRDYHPFTRKLQAVRCELTDDAKRDFQGPEGVNSIIFVDTPSFLTECEHFDARREFEKWFNNGRYKARPEYVGVIYVHRVETDPRVEPIDKHLQELSTAFPAGDSPRRLHVVVTYDNTSGTVSPEKIKDRSIRLGTQLEEAKKSIWKASIQSGLFQGEPDVAWSAVAELFKD